MYLVPTLRQLHTRPLTYITAPDPHHRILRGCPVSTVQMRKPRAEQLSGLTELAQHRPPSQPLGQVCCNGGGGLCYLKSLGFGSHPVTHSSTHPFIGIVH